MSPRLIAFVLTTTSVASVLVLAVLLAGCGGGDADEPTAAVPVKPACTARPEVCA